MDIATHTTRMVSMTIGSIDQRLTTNFTLRELIHSEYAVRHGIDNMPDEGAFLSLKSLCSNVLQPLRNAFGPIQVMSGYRSPEVNKGIGGSKTSQHMKGEAADLRSIDYMKSTADLVLSIIGLNLPYDQLILEYYQQNQPHSGWVHVSYSSKMRKKILTYDGKQYKNGLHI